MSYPNINSLKSIVSDSKLAMTTSTISHPAFVMLLKALNSDKLEFFSPEIEDNDENSDLVILGESTIGDVPLKNSALCFYNDAAGENNYDFEWQGTLPAASLKQLYKLGLLLPQRLNMVEELLGGMFTDIELLYNSHNKALALAADSSDLQLQIPGVGVTLQEVGFFYERSLDSSINNTYLLSATIEIGTTKISTEIALPAGNKLDPVRWRLSLTEGVILNNGLADVVTFFSGQASLSNRIGIEIFNALPEKIRQLPTLILSGLNVVFHPSKGLQAVDLSVTSFKPFELFPDFVIHNIGFGVFVSLTSSGAETSLTLSGSFIFSGFLRAAISILVPLNTADDWIIELEGSLDFDNIRELEKLPFIKLSDLNLPKDWLNVHDVHMDDLEIVFNPVERKIRSVHFNLQLNAESSLIPGIKIKNPYLTFNLTF